jgi:hypothetical protein
MRCVNNYPYEIILMRCCTNDPRDSLQSSCAVFHPRSEHRCATLILKRNTRTGIARGEATSFPDAYQSCTSIRGLHCGHYISLALLNMQHRTVYLMFVSEPSALFPLTVYKGELVSSLIHQLATTAGLLGCSKTQTMSCESTA